MAARPLDYLLAYVGFALILCQHAFVAAQFASPDPYSQLPYLAVALVVAAPASVLYLRRGGSVGDVGSFYVTLILFAVGVGIAAFLVLSLLGADSTLGPTPSVALLLAGDAVAYLRVYRDAF
ncbi:hypothetical protein [Halopelagius fulvigenes]|uniref:Integral membrane protein n=1 Tax=Halopelagius fulvigenes TaxID=1198324 RepID=A0ABD5U0H2_9EURY